MQNKGIVIWLALLSAYILWQDFQHYNNYEVRNNNVEARKEIYANTKERFEALETYLKGPLNERISHIEKFLGDNWGEE